MADPFSFAIMTIAQIGISFLFPAEGPRLRDLKITASTYGAAIPESFGLTRVAGNMIWALPIKEHKKTQLQGKGGAVNTYTYTDSFAMAFCKGPVADLRRLWCDGKLIYDATVLGQTNNQKYKFRIYYGDEDQNPDSLIEADRGVGNTPAYRGLCYIVFEDMPLADFGDRIPQMTAEVYRDGTASSISPSAELVWSGYDAGVSYQLGLMRVDPYNGYVWSITTDGLRRYSMDSGTEDLFVSNGQMQFVDQGRAIVPNDGMNITGVLGVKQDGNLVITKGGAWCGVNILMANQNYRMGHFDGKINIFGDFPITDPGDPLHGMIRYTSCLNTTDQSAMCVTTGGEEWVCWVGTLGEVYTHNTIDTDPNTDSDRFRRGGQLVHGTDTEVPRGGIICGSYGYSGTPTWFRAIGTRIDQITPGTAVEGIATLPAIGNNPGIQWMSFDQVDPGIVCCYAHDTFSMRLAKYGLSEGKWLYDVPMPNVDAGSVYGKAPPFLNGMWGFVSNNAISTTLWLVDTTTGMWVTRDGQRQVAFQFDDTASILESTQTTYAGIPVQEPPGAPFTTTGMQYFDPLRMSIFTLGAGYGNNQNQIVRITRSPVQPTNLATIVSTILQEGGLSQNYIDMSRLAGINVWGYGWARGTDVKSVLDDLKRLYLFDIIESQGMLVGVLRGVGTDEVDTGQTTANGSSNWTAGYAGVNQITLSAGQTLNGVAAVPAGNSPTSRGVGLLYADNNGLPGALLAKSAIVTGMVAGTPTKYPFITSYTAAAEGEKVWVGQMIDTANFNMNVSNFTAPGGKYWNAGTLATPANPAPPASGMGSFNGQWVIYGYGTSSESVPQDVLGSSSPDATDFWQETRTQEAELPSQVTLTYMNLDDNYETSLARSTRLTNPIPTMFSRQIVAIEATVVMEPAEAKERTDAILYTQWGERTKYTTRLPWAYLDLDPADMINVNMNDGRAYYARIDRTEIGSDYAISTEAWSQDNGAYNVPTRAADGGGNGINPTLALPAPVRPLVLNTPLLRDQDDSGGSYSLYYAGVGSTTARQFGGAALYESSDDTTFTSSSSFDNDAEWGTTMAAVPAPKRGWYSLDWESKIVIWPMVTWFDLQSITDDELWAGGNACVIGEEVLQFRDCVKNGDGTWTIWNLLRGRRGTEYACDNHQIGETFVFLSNTTIRMQSETIDQGGQPRYFKALGKSATLTGAQEEAITYQPRDLMPYAPADIRREVNSDGSLTITWARRTRMGGGWQNLVGTVPLHETTEAYEVYLLDAPFTGDTSSPYPPATFLAAATTSTPEATFVPSSLTGFDVNLDTLTVVVYQVSTAVGRGFPGVRSIEPWQTF